MTQLSRLSKLGIAKESTPNTYLAPTAAIPFTKAAFEDVQAPLRDESVRTNDAVLQGLYPGPSEATWDIEMNMYPDVAGHFFRAMIGPDTIVAGVSTTLAAAITSIGATSFSSTVTIPTGSTVQLDTGALAEYVVTGAATGSGPFIIPITSPATGVTKTHLTATPVVSQTLHSFAMARTSSTVWPTYSITVDDLTDVRGYPGCVCSDLAVKVDPKGMLTINPKFTGFPSAIQSTFTPAYTALQPFLGWEWTMNDAGAASTRGLTIDLTFKRAVEAIQSSDGTQGPREIFPGAMELDGKFKAIYENDIDLNLFMNYSQQPAVVTLTQPVGGANAGAVLTFTSTKTGWYKAVVDLGSTYVQADYDIQAIYNATDAGISKVTLSNFTSTAY